MTLRLSCLVAAARAIGPDLVHARGSGWEVVFSIGELDPALTSVGAWSGTWSSFNPAQSMAQPKAVCKTLDAGVVRDADA